MIERNVRVIMLFRTKKTRAYTLLFLDSILNVISWIIAGSIRHGFLLFMDNWFPMSSYLSTLAMILFCYAFLYISGEDDRQDIVDQGPYTMLVSVVRNQVLLIVFIILYLFVTKQGGELSRFIMGYFFVANILLEFIVRILYRKFLYYYVKNNSNENRVLLVTLENRAEIILKNLHKKNGNFQNITSIVLLDADRIGQNIMGVPIIGDRDSMFATHREHVYDEVFINIPFDYEIALESVIMGFEQMGLTVNLNIDVFNISVEEKVITNFGDYKVISFATKNMNSVQMLLKRLMDIAGSMIGLFLTGILTLILAPIIKIQSPGPVFFSQERVGINGRRFKIYKFRSMYADAEERKKELMEQNEMQGLMFKMKNDPRVTPIGRWIRRTSLDEFPQFLNVLRGDMSLVGTRPPTIDEYSQYENYHLKRLSIRPGITGLWQVSGRNEVRNFEDVVKLDFQYIDQWSLLLDIKIILQTVGVMFGRNAKWSDSCCILGVNISVMNMPETVQYITQNIKELSGKYICVSNVHTTIMSYENPEYLAIQNGAALTLPDGKPLSVEAKKRGCQTIGRVTGPDLMGEIFKISVWNGYKHYFYGSSEETLDKLKTELLRRYPGIEIAGMVSPPYRELTPEEDAAEIRKMQEAQADFVWIGLGAPKQENYMAAHKGLVPGVMIGVGAGFDYYAGNIARAPMWMQKCSLEWLYRLLQDPKKLFKRYLNTNGKFLILVRRENRRLKKEAKKENSLFLNRN